ncbi:MAG: SDR family NAD(P)-dependent oxidoreductase [Hyphomicrobiaceae bacterium]|nr:SDR family NAD(P)-dependent oxidoreductase [Hyphomicrobiaceae bacterium]
MHENGTILITGASSGIGWAAAVRLKARGWRVLATARNEADRERLAGEAGVEPLHLELSDHGSIERCAEAALGRTGGRIDALFNNAAYGQVGAVEDLSADVLRRQLEVNVIGTHELTRRLIPSMRANGSGRIVQCSSVLGLVAGPYRGAYCASKFALEALSDSMRVELAGSGVFVVLIEPGPIRTRFVDTALRIFRESIDIEGSVHRATYEARLKAMEAGGKQRFKLEPDAVVDKLVLALESPRPRLRYFVTTPTYVAAGLKRVLPMRLMDRLVHRM